MMYFVLLVDDQLCPATATNGSASIEHDVDPGCGRFRTADGSLLIAAVAGRSVDVR